MNDPWFRMHANIGDKPVVWRLAAATGISTPKAVGHLAMFWGKVTQHAPHGNVADIPDAQLEGWAGWDGKRGAFAAWLRADHLSEGVVNEYDEYSGKLEERRERDRQRKAAAKESPPVVEPSRNSDGIPSEASRNSGVRNVTIRNDVTTPTKSTKGASSRKRGESAPWMGEVRAVWGEVFPQSPGPTKGVADALRSLVAKQGIDMILPELRRYLTSFSDPKLMNLPKWASTFGGVDPDVKANAPTSRAAKWIRFAIDQGFTATIPIEQHDARIDDLAAQGVVKNAERMKAELRAVAPWMTLKGMRQGESERYEERVAKLLQQATQAAA